MCSLVLYTSSFSTAGPPLWNSLPEPEPEYTFSRTRRPTDNIPEKTEIIQFDSYTRLLFFTELYNAMVDLEFFFTL